MVCIQQYKANKLEKPSHFPEFYPCIVRCQHCIAAGKQDGLDIAVDGGKWHAINAAQLSSHLPASDLLAVPPVTGWKTFPSQAIPQMFNYGHIYHYLLESVPTSTSVIWQW